MIRQLILTVLFLTTSTGCAMAQQNELVSASAEPQAIFTARDFADSESYRSSDRIVATYYFYWYNVDTKEHIVNGDGSDALTDHPAPQTMPYFSYASVRWHKKEFSDMMDAGIDVALPVYWGAPSEHDPKAHLHWSFAGIKPMVQAREELLKEGKKPPKIGLFYDTSTLQYNAKREHIDLTTDAGRRWFYETIRDFFALVPPKHWAMVDGKPLVFLYAAAFAKKYDQSCIDYAKEQFAKDFGGRTPYIVREVSWQVKSDSVYAWGGALGLKPLSVASLGPGYDHTAVPGRAPLIVKREGGKFYEECWLKFLRKPTNIVAVETWNELHEGTDVCESKEYGRQYIELTRKYVDLFKQGWKPPRPQGKYANAKSVQVVLGKQNQESGLKQVESGDGATAPATLGGKECRAIQPTANQGRYVYFIVDDSFKWTDSMDVTVEVEYFDAAVGTLHLEFDGSDPNAPFNGAYTQSSETVQLTGSKTWRTAQFRLNQARFLNSQNSSADFRLAVTAAEFGV